MAMKIGATVLLPTQWMKNPPARQETQETRVRSLGWEDPLEEEMVTHSGILAWRIPWTREAWQATVYGVTQSWTRLSDYACWGAASVISVPAFPKGFSQCPTAQTQQSTAHSSPR